VEFQTPARVAGDGPAETDFDAAHDQSSLESDSERCRLVLWLGAFLEEAVPKIITSISCHQRRDSETMDFDQKIESK